MRQSIDEQFDSSFYLETDKMIQDDDDSMMMSWSELHVDSVPPSSGLEELSPDTADILLSFLSMPDYAALSLVSKRMHACVTAATHLHMPPTTVPSITDRKENIPAQLAPQSVLRFDENSLRRLLERYESLNVLELKGLAAVGDNLFKVLNDSSASSTIHRLELEGVSLTYWCHDKLDLPNLKHLRISGASIRASLASLFGTRLQSLSIGLCASIRDDQVQELVHLNPALVNLELQQCLRIKKPTIAFDEVQRLSLMGCFGLGDLPRFHCPKLRHLDLSFCFRLPNKCIQSIVDGLENLEELTLVKCPTLTTLTIASESIRVINLNYSNNLQTLRLCCPNLVHLENVACSSLSTLIIDDALSLTSLHLSHLPLTRLEVTSPMLRRLNLANCRELNHCCIRCPRLEMVNVKNSRTVALRFCREVREVVMKDWTRRTLSAQ